MPRVMFIPDTAYITNLRGRIANAQKAVDQLKQRLHLEYEELPTILTRHTLLLETLKRGNNNRCALFQERKELAVMIDKFGKERRCSEERLTGCLSVLNTLRLELEITEANVDIQSWFR